MATRIVWIVILGFVIVHYAGEQQAIVWEFAGLFWMARGERSGMTGASTWPER